MLSLEKIHVLLVCKGRRRAHPSWDDEGLDLFRMGAEMPLTGTVTFPPCAREVVPPREEGGALPGLGLAGGLDGDYGLASKAWAHINGGSKHTEQWKLVLEMCRKGEKVPSKLIPKGGAL